MIWQPFPFGGFDWPYVAPNIEADIKERERTLIQANCGRVKEIERNMIVFWDCESAIETNMRKATKGLRPETKQILIKRKISICVKHNL
jgi:hypothetical protein